MSTLARLTIGDYDRMIATGVFDGPNKRRIELIRGELREMSPIGPLHEEIVDFLNKWSFEQLPRGEVRTRIQNSVGVPELDSAPEPDVAWVEEKSYASGRPTVEDVLLIIEVAESSLAYDRGEKAELYAEAGVRDYWVVDISERCAEVRRDPHNRHYRSLQTFSEGDEVRSLTFPDVGLPVASLFPSDES